MAEVEKLSDDIMDKLEHNFMIDLLVKKDMSTEERKQVIKRYMERNKLGIRPLAKQLNIPFTSLYYWINPEKKKEQTEKYDIKKKGRTVKEELSFVEHILINTLNRIDDKKFKCTDEDRVVIESIKDKAIMLHYKTMKISDKR